MGLENFEVSSGSDFMNDAVSLLAVKVSGRDTFPLTGDCPDLIGDFGVLNGRICLCFCGETGGGCAVWD